ncbi:hypothetical protein KP509_1Z322700 [Ceratopteris richardii]|nr:hypothetical protein KP509_1Z322700 [Ceratopteris richardii]
MSFWTIYVAIPTLKKEYQSQYGNLSCIKHNNIFVDLKLLQHRMVKFCDVSNTKCNGILKFVIKLGESEVLKDQKWERFTLTLMNRAIDGAILETDIKYFNVQSEQYIWSLNTREL